MKLRYSGDDGKIKFIVSRANEIISSPFFIQEFRKLLINENRGCYFNLYKNILQSEESIIVKTSFNIFSKKKIRPKLNMIAINRIRFNGAHKDLLALLVENIYRVINSQNKVLRHIYFKDKEEKNAFFKKVGSISKHYI